MEINKKKSFLPWLIVAAVLIFVVATYLLLNSMDSYTFKEKAYYPLMGTNLEISPGTKATIAEGEDHAVLKLDKAKVTCEEVPAFFPEKKGLVTLSTWAMITLEPDQSLGMWRLSPFSEVRAAGTTVIVSKGNKNEVSNAAFLYNGADTYVLLKDAVLHLQEGDVELPAFSYVISKYDNWIQYQNYNTGEYAICYPKQQGIWMSVPAAGIEVCVDCDRMEYSGHEYMLISSLSFLDDFFSKKK